MTKKGLPARQFLTAGKSRNKTKQHGFRNQAAMVAITAAVMGGQGAYAFEIETDTPELKVRWDNTVKYSSAWRMNSPDSKLVSAAANTQNPNLDDGDLNFKRGQISNRLDLLSELDVAYQNVGFRISAAAWDDSKYLGSNANSGATANQISVPGNQFISATKKIHGSNAEFLDAFAFAKFDLDGKRGTVRAGKHSQVWGESLFFGANAIAGGMMPVDVVKLVSVPNTQFKEAIRPVQMLSGQLQLNSNVSIAGYYQYRWAPNRLPASGSYFSQVDPNPDGGESLNLGFPFLNPATRTDDQRASNTGQGGLQLRLRDGDTDYGFYLIRFHNKGFQQVANLGLMATGIPAPGCAGAGGVVIGGVCNLAAPSTYRLAYHEGITAFGASFSHTFGDLNLAGEASIRHNQDLASPNASDVSALTGGAANNNNSNPAYAVGNTAHINLSSLWSLAPSSLFPESSVVAEVAWNRLLHVTKNGNQLDPNATRDAVAFRGIFEPVYRQVVPGLDLSVPIGLGWSPKGSRSAVLGPGAFPADGGGDFSVGVNATYLDAWRFSLSYTHYFGETGAFLTPTSATTNSYSYKQSLADRDFIAFSVRRTF